MNLSIIYIYIYFLDILQLESFPFLIYHLLFLHYFNKKKKELYDLSCKYMYQRKQKLQFSLPYNNVSLITILISKEIKNDL